MEELEDPKPEVSDPGDVEDVPSDFFDDFSNDDFIEGLSVVDSWNKNKNASRNNSEIKDEEEKDGAEVSEKNDLGSSRSSRLNRKSPSNLDSTSSRMSDIIKPGSRRDPDKTNKAIIKDKEEKVKKYLAKRLESPDNLKPPGTELDDFMDEKVPSKPVKKNKPKFIDEELKVSRKRISPAFHEYPVKKYRPSKPRDYHDRNLGRYSPNKNVRRYSPGWRSPVRRSPNRRRHSPVQHMRYHSRSPGRRNFYRNSPSNRLVRHSPHSAPRRSPRRSYRSKTPHRRELRRSHSRSPNQRNLTNFMYPMPQPQANEFYAPYYPAQSDSSYMQGDHGSMYTGYSVMPSMVPPVNMQFPTISVNQPIPNMNPDPPPSDLIAHVPQSVPSQINYPSVNTVNYNPYDGLAKLYAEGKISKEDYLKLAPKDAKNQLEDSQRISVMSRCNIMVSNLSKLLLPKSLVVDSSTFDSDRKCLLPKYCSPLKRQAEVQFQFTKHNNKSTMARRNKRLVDSIIATLDLGTVVPRSKTSSKTTRDMGVQTMKPFCELCSIRESREMVDESTCVDYEHFSSSIHTQVVEQDLKNSRAVFNPSGGLSDGAHISIAHMTPAQLVSQLAARAKTLQQTDNYSGSSHSHSRLYGGNRFGNREQQQEYQQNYYRY